MLLALMAIHSSAAKRKLLTWSVRFLRENYRLDTEAQSLEFDLLAGRAELRGLRIGSNPAAKPFLEADRVETAFRMLPPRLGAVRVTGLRLSVLVAKDGTTNLPEQSKSTTGPANYEALPQAVHIEDASLFFEDQKTATRVHLPSISLEASREPGAREHLLRLSSSAAGEVRSEGRSWKIDAAGAEARTDLSRWTVTRLDVRCGESTANLSGTAASHPKTELGLRGRFVLDLTELARRPGLSGTVKAEVSLAGSLGSLEAAVKAAGEGIRLPGLLPGNYSVTARWLENPNRIDILQARGAVPRGEVAASGKVYLSRGPSEIDVRVVRLNLPLITRALGMRPEIASSATGKMHLGWNAIEWGTLRGEADLTLEERPDADAPAALPVSGSLRTRLDAREVRLIADSISTPGLILRGEAAVQRRGGELSGKLSGKLDSLDRLNDTLRRIDPAWALPSGFLLDGDLSVEGSLAGTARSPALEARLSSSHMSAGKLTGVAANANLTLDTTKLVLNDATLMWQDAVLRLSGSVGLEAGNHPIDWRVSLEGASIPALLRNHGIEAPLEGTLGAIAEVSGTLREPQVRLAARGERIAAYGEALGTMTARARQEGALLALDDFRLVRSEGEFFTASARLGLESNEYEVDVSGTPYEIRSLTLPGGRKVRGSLRLSGQGRGRLADPLIEARLEADRLEIDEYKLGPVRLQAGVSGGFASLRLEIPQSQLSGQARVALTRPYLTDFAFESAGVDLAAGRLQLGVGQPVAGVMAGTLRGRGPLAEPQRFAAQLNLAELQLFTPGHDTIRNEGPVEAALQDGTVNVKRSRLRGENLDLILSGALPLEGETSESGIAVRGRLALKAVTSFLPAGSGVHAGGIVELDGAVSGSFASPAMRFQATVKDGRVEHASIPVPVENLAARIESDGSALSLSGFRADFAGGEIRASGRAALGARGQSQPGEVVLKMDLTKIDLARVLKLPADTTSTGSAHIELDAPEFAIKKLSGSAVFSELTLRRKDLAVEQAAPAMVRLERGRILVEGIHATGKDTDLKISGEAELTGSQSLLLNAEGRLETALLGTTSRAFSISGPSFIRLQARGTLTKPRIEGSWTLENGRFLMASPALAVDDLRARLQFAEGIARLDQFEGEANGGGSVSATGTLRLPFEGEDALNLAVKGEGVFLDYPRGFRTVSDHDLKIASDGRTWAISGDTIIVDGGYRDAIDIATMTSAITKPAPPDAGDDTNELLRKIRFNINLKSKYPVVLDNNLARLEATSALRLTGSALQPGLTGRLEIPEGGRIYLSGRSFTLNRSSIDFVNETRIQPRLNLSAETRISDYDIIFRLGGEAERLEINLSASPPASDAQITSLLLTGSADNAANYTNSNLLQTQALTLLGSGLTGRFSLGFQRAVGLSEFRIEPGAISADSNPTARLTVGQNITDELKLVYSTNLSDSSDQIWTAEYDWRRKILARVIQQTKESDRVEGRHRIEFGGGPDTGELPRTRREKLRIGSVVFRGELRFPEAELLKQMKLKKGKRYEFNKVLESMDRLGRFYAKKGYLEARVRILRDQQSGVLNLEGLVSSGPLVSFVYEGFDVPKSVRKQVGAAWKQGVIDFQRAEAARDLIRRHLIRNRYSDAEVAYRPGAATADLKRVVWDIKPGLRYEQTGIVFEGLSQRQASELRADVKAAFLDTEVHSRPGDISAFAKKHFAQRGYLAAEAGELQIKKDPGGRRQLATLAVTPGRRYTIAGIELNGNKSVPSADLIREMNLRAGDPYAPTEIATFANKVEQKYWSLGYRDATATAKAIPDPKLASVRLVVDVVENQPSLVGNIAIAGNKRTGQDFIRGILRVDPGQRLDFERINETRKNLLESNAYTLVDVNTPPQAGASGPAGSPRSVDVQVNLREIKPYFLNYGLLLDSEKGIGYTGDFVFRNMLGAARSLGFRYRQDRDLHEERVYFSQPFFLGRRLATDAAVILEQQKLETALQGRLPVDSFTYTIQQSWYSSDRKNIFSYGYEYERADFTLRLKDGEDRAYSVAAAPLVVTATRDTRDDVLDASRGFFLSNAVRYGPGWLGGDLTYVKYYGQLYKYFPLTRRAQTPFSFAPRSRLVFATGTRFGTIDAPAGTVYLPTDLFYAGGGTTIRGYDQNSIIPVGAPEASDIGARVTFILNNELRFPLYKFFDGVVFLDSGNVYLRPADFDPLKLRSGAGFGIRLRNPFVLLRFDYGWKLGRQPGESAGAFFFSIGQAF